MTEIMPFFCAVLGRRFLYFLFLQQALDLGLQVENGSLIHLVIALDQFPFKAAQRIRDLGGAVFFISGSDVSVRASSSSTSSA